MHVVDILVGRGDDRVSKLRGPFYERRHESVEKSQHVVTDEDPAVTLGSGANTDGWYSHARRDRSSHFGGHHFQHDCECAGFLESDGIGKDCVALGRLRSPLQISADLSTDCGSSPRWPITGMPTSTRRRTTSIIGRPPSIFTAPAPPS